MTEAIDAEIKLSDLKRRIALSDIETLKYLDSTLREEKRIWQRSIAATVITSLVGALSVLSSFLPKANAVWVGIAAAAIAAGIGYWAFASTRKAQVRRTLRALDEAENRRLAPEEEERLREQVVKDLLGRWAK